MRILIVVITFKQKLNDSSRPDAFNIKTLCYDMYHIIIPHDPIGSYRRFYDLNGTWCLCLNMIVPLSKLGGCVYSYLQYDCIKEI